MFAAYMLLVASSTSLLLSHLRHESIFSVELGGLDSLIEHKGFLWCSDGSQEPGDLIGTQQLDTVVCLHAGRMPLAAYTIFTLVNIFGTHYSVVTLCKALLSMVPILVAFWLVSDRAMSCRYRPRLYSMVLFAATFMLPAVLLNIVDIDAEECYTTCFLACCCAIVLFWPAIQNHVNIWSAVFVLMLIFLYLAKSSMMLAALFLILGCGIRSGFNRRFAAVVALVLCAPLLWGLYVDKVSGRFSVGTSVDEMNLHKGNNPDFLQEYQPKNGGDLDPYDIQLRNGHIFTSEWQMSDYHKSQAVAYIRHHPWTVLYGGLRKAEVFFITLTRRGDDLKLHPGIFGITIISSMVLFRLLLWSAMVVATIQLKSKIIELRFSALFYLGVVLTVAAPYLIGFAVTRHVSVLALPSALFFAHRWLYTPSAQLIGKNNVLSVG